ncbi:hypothetical protein, partial [Paraliomyxa miuraensis]|uniref:hypothetical protein n=1 Tax=Paraliomyxa miuraensis TaxID=376150 RepID=UPI002251A4CD
MTPGAQQQQKRRRAWMERVAGSVDGHRSWSEKKGRRSVVRRYGQDRVVAVAAGRRSIGEVAVACPIPLPSRRS